MLVITAALATALAATVDIEATGHAQSGDRIVSASTGIALTVPAGMSARLEGEALVLEGPSGTGGLVVVDPQLTLDGAYAATVQGLVIGGGFFHASGDPRRTSKTLTVPLASSDGSYVGQGFATLATASPLSVVMVGPASASSTVNTQFRTLVGSLGKAPAPSPTASRSSGPWLQALRGRQIRHYESGGNSSARTTVDLCTDGTVHASHGSSFHSTTMDVADVAGAGRGTASGRWRVQGSTLTIEWADGSRDQRTLSYGPSGELLLDGSRWLRTDLERCR